jgi:threonylcarbamoyladenosine tRNA methylthiotransferase MtaB
MRGKRLSVLLEEKILADGKEYLTGHSMEYVRAAVSADGSCRENDIVTICAEGFLAENLLTGSVVF